MILQKLAEYYHRLANDPNSDIAPEGFERKEIPFVIVLDENGSFVDLKNTREPLPGEKKILRVKKYLVPKGQGRSGRHAWKIAYPLWDTIVYVLGFVAEVEDSTIAEKKRSRFQEVQTEWFGENPDNRGLKAIQDFLQRKDFKSVFTHPLWPEVSASEGNNITFALAGDVYKIIAEHPDVQKIIAAKVGQPTDTAGTGICLVSGTDAAIARTHVLIKGVWGAQNSGANIVSFNFPSVTSFGKEQGANSPIGIPTMFAYTTALNTLLAKDSKQRFQAGDASVVFWAKNATPLESLMRDMWEEPPKENPERMKNAVQALQAAPHTGYKPILEDETPFYILGLSPNAARISVRFWQETTVKELAKNILQHFEDISLVHGAKEPEYLALFRLLTATAAQGKSENIPPNLAGVMLEAILSDTPYPYSALQNAVMRLRAELSSDLHYRDYPRAALIKACINRRIRHNLSQGKELTVALDPTNNNIGYCLGRLFAALEKIQEEALPGLNATIRDRYYGAASSTPVTVFGTLMKLKNHHLSKIDHKGRVHNLEKLLGQIIDHFQDFPTHLTLDDQGRFAIGYYHQRQNFYTKSEIATPEEKDAA